LPNHPVQLEGVSGPAAELPENKKLKSEFLQVKQQPSAPPDPSGLHLKDKTLETSATPA
jgi:hypothetical protein